MSTSTSCSARCGAQRTVRAALGGQTILGTSITCSATRKSRGESMSTNCSTVCGSTMKSFGTTGTESAICSTVCHWIRSCGRPSTRGGGRTSSALVTSFRLRRASYAVPTWNEWWVTVASAIASVIRSCVAHDRSRRSLHQGALDVPPAASRAAISNEGHPLGPTERLVTHTEVSDPEQDDLVVVVVVRVCVWWWRE